MMIKSQRFRKLVQNLFHFKGVRAVGHLVRRLNYLNQCVCINDFDGNIKFYCYLNEHIGSHMYWRGAYSPAQLHLLEKLLTDKMVFIDIGANQGEFTLFAAKRLPNGRVLAFEPMAEMYIRLQRNIEINIYSNIKTIQIGLWSEDTHRQLYVSGEKFNDGSINEGLGTLFPTTSREVAVQQTPLTTLDSFLKKTEDGLHINIIKIDVEGAEYHVLKGAVKTIERYHPIILLEANRTNAIEAGGSLEELLNFLGRWYRFELIMQNGMTRPVQISDLGEHQDLLCLPR